jgi:acyl-CoA reductase-like NAD-dependent aldehyde dehydrogenase
MKLTHLAASLLTLALLAGLGGCTKKEDGMGPAQKAGQAVDNAGDKVARDLQEKLDKANAAAKQVSDSAQQTRDRIAEATADATADASKGLDAATDKVGKEVEQAGEKIQDSARK